MYNGFTYPLKINDNNRKLIEQVRCEADKLYNVEIKSLNYSTFKLFHETGDRPRYEAQYMEHRKMLIAFSVMAFLGEDEKWTDKLCDILWAVCDEFSWSLPAHLSADNTPLQSVERIDLFAAETSVALCEILHILDGKLPVAVVDRVTFELERRIVNSYMKNRFLYGRNNWAGVCTCGIAAAFIYLKKDKEFSEIKELILENIERFISSFPDDGCCLEGSLYWAYGFSHFCYLAELLRQYTDGELDYFKNEKVKKIAMFCQNMYLDENYVISFSDSPHTYDYDPGHLVLLSKKYDEIILPPEKYAASFGDGARFRFANTIRSLYWTADFPDDSIENKSFVFYDKSQWYINKKNSYIFVAKGGCNSEPHNHNDVGSFLVFDGGDYIIDDVGWPQYYKGYFEPEIRYAKEMCSMSQGHSLPVVDGAGQKFGSEYAAKDVSADENRFSLDISGAYAVSSLDSFVRSFELFKDHIVLKESASGSFGKIIHRFVTRIKPEICGNMVCIKNYSLSCEAPCELSFSTYVFKPRFSGFLSDNEGLQTAYMIDFVSQSGECEFIIKKNR